MTVVSDARSTQIVLIQRYNLTLYTVLPAEELFNEKDEATIATTVHTSLEKRMLT